MRPLPAPRSPGLCIALLGLALAAHLAAQPVDIHPVHTGPWARSLAGEWTFKYLASSDLGLDEPFHQPTFEPPGWGVATVPGHWELQGFAEPKYRMVDEGTGLYRTNFNVPDDWDGRRIFLRFEGVLYGFEAWVNGTSVGTWASGYNAVTFDVTDAVRRGDDNLLAVRVTTRNKGFEFDLNDCWALSGIYRDVTLFSTPAAHVRDLTTHTTLTSAGGAVLHLSLQAAHPSGTAVQAVARLRAPDGSIAGTATVNLDGTGRGQADLAVAQPLLWTAETPSLYHLELDLHADNQVVQTVAERIGLRQVTVEDGILKLNGHAIKLRGINRHDLEPDTGRTLTTEQMRRDLALIKAANVNFVRASHYPLDRRFFELCDELGLYVLNEVPYGFGDEHLTDLSYQDILLTRARATVMRDKNRASVIIWGLGNENPVTPIGLETGRYMKQLDPTRPICFPQVGSYFLRTHPQLPEFVDIYAPHYPPNTDLMQRYAAELTRPIIHTEYAHALGLASDRIHGQWETIQANPRYAGGAVWHFHDQGLLRRSPTPVDRTKPTNYVWIDPHHYYDTNVLDGTDGMVYTDRTPQTDYWQLRKVYAPVRLTAGSALLRPGPQSFPLTIESRFDVRSLAGMRLVWTLQRNGRAIQQGEVALGAPARGSERVTLTLDGPAQAGDGVFALETRFIDEQGNGFYERVLPLQIEGASAPAVALLAGMEPVSITSREFADELVRIDHPRFSVELNRRSGALTIRDAAGHEIVRNAGPHTGRRFTMTEVLRAGISSVWQGPLLKPVGPVETMVTRTAAGSVQLSVRGSYERPDTAGQFIDGSYTLVVTQAGTIEISYDYAPRNATGTFLEAGFALSVNPAHDQFRWIGQGPYAGYPGKEQLNEFGLHHLSSADLRFHGNRRGVQVAVISNLAGSGLALAGDGMDIAVENASPAATHALGDGGLIISHNAVLAGLGNKNVMPETSIPAENVSRLTGSFKLLPLGQTWPASLTSWFGHPSTPATVQAPFYYSYDQ